MLRSAPSLTGRRVLITGAARGLGAGLADRLHEEGAKVALLGLEPELLAEVAARCGNAPWRECDVADGDAIDRAVEELVAELGGLDVVVANAGIAKQLPIIGGNPKVMEKTLEVNVLGTYRTLRAAGPHIAHPGGYALAVASLAAAVHVPLLGAYSASKAATEAIGDTLRGELLGTGARVGVAYFSELDTDMTSRGFDTEAVKALSSSRASITRVAPARLGIEAMVRGIARRKRRVYAPGWVGAVLPIRMVAQRVVELAMRPNIKKVMAAAQNEDPPFTTPQPGGE